MITYLTPLLALASSYNVIAPLNVALLTPKEVDEKLDTLMRPSGTMNDEPETPIAVGAGASKLA